MRPIGQSYNRSVKLTALALALLTLAGCSSQNIQTKEAVKEAIVSYLNARAQKTGINMGAMNVEVNTMSFQADHATVGVSFNLKTGEGGMQMSYELDREGNKWVVKGASTTGKESGGMPPNHPPAGGALPPGHPPAGGSRQ